MSRLLTFFGNKTTKLRTESLAFQPAVATANSPSPAVKRPLGPKALLQSDQVVSASLTRQGQELSYDIRTMTTRHDCWWLWCRADPCLSPTCILLGSKSLGSFPRLSPTPRERGAFVLPTLNRVSRVNRKEVATSSTSFSCGLTRRVARRS